MQTKARKFFLSALLISFVLLSGCTATDSSPTASASSPTLASSPDPNPSSAETPTSNRPRLEGKATIVMTVKGSPITIEVNGTDAPLTAGNFVDLVQRKVYDGLMFHRVVRDPKPFVVQGGDPQSKDPNADINRLGIGGFIDPATGKPRQIPLEIKPQDTTQPIVYSKPFRQAGITKPPVLKHTRGAVAMARSQMPDSASSQFYFALDDLAFLDGEYAVFGYVTQGMEVVDKIQQGDRIEGAKIIQGAENLKGASPVPATSATTPVTTPVTTPLTPTPTTSPTPSPSTSATP